MNVAFASHGAYLSTTTIAFPEDVITPPVKLPTLSAGYVTKDAFYSERYEAPPAEVVTADLTLMKKIYGNVEKLLSDGSARHLYDIHPATRELLPKFEDKISTYTQATYEALEALYREGRLEIIKERVPAEKENETAPYYKFKLR